MYRKKQQCSIKIRLLNVIEKGERTAARCVMFFTSLEVQSAPRGGVGGVCGQCSRSWAN